MKLLEPIQIDNKPEKSPGVKLNANEISIVIHEKKGSMTISNDTAEELIKTGRVLLTPALLITGQHIMVFTATEGTPLTLSGNKGKENLATSNKKTIEAIATMVGINTMETGKKYIITLEPCPKSPEKNASVFIISDCRRDNTYSNGEGPEAPIQSILNAYANN